MRVEYEAKKKRKDRRRFNPGHSQYLRQSAKCTQKDKGKKHTKIKEVSMRGKYVLNLMRQFVFCHFLSDPKYTTVSIRYVPNKRVKKTTTIAEFNNKIDNCLNKITKTITNSSKNVEINHMSPFTLQKTSKFAELTKKTVNKF